MASSTLWLNLQKTDISDVPHCLDGYPHKLNIENVYKNQILQMIEWKLFDIVNIIHSIKSVEVQNHMHCKNWQQNSQSINQQTTTKTL